MKILVTGATGYVGCQLSDRLIVAGHDVVCLVRDPGKLSMRSFSKATVLVGDALQPLNLDRALAGVEVAYYLIHSMSGAEHGFAQRDRQAAYNFAAAARRAGVRRIIYLGGLASSSSPISPHLKSRQETGDILREFGPPVTEFRSGVIVGNGSTSFEMIRYLTERLPVMICPRWVVTPTQPIAIGDVLDYLTLALDTPASTGRIIEIGGATVETYRSMMLTYARARGLRRFLIRVPVLTPRLSSYWLDFVTPCPPSVTRPLIEGLRTASVCLDHIAANLFPGIRPMSYLAAVKAALSRGAIEPPVLAPPQKRATGASQGFVFDINEAVVNASAERVYSVVENMGGSQGWLFANWLWRLRGVLDRIVGGVGMRRGRARDFGMRRNDHVDFWRVEDVVPGRKIVLRAEMKVPGRAWLRFDVTPSTSGGSILRCAACFEPRGLFGELYWWALFPIHVVIFRGMVHEIAKRAEFLEIIPLLVQDSRTASAGS